MEFNVVQNSSFVIKKSSSNEYYFVLKAAGNSQIIARSEMYTTKQSCEGGIDSVKENAPNADIIDES